MVLYLIGLGLGDEDDITVKGLEKIKQSDFIYLEHYTSVLIDSDLEKLEKYYGKKITLADREMIESKSDIILNNAKTKEVCLLVVGDVFSATTHSDFFLRAKESKIPIKVIHNAGIINAISSCGLQLYTFGQVVSIPLFLENWKPDSFYDKIKVNKENGLHTLCLLDIKVKEPNIKILETKGKYVYDPPYFMTIKTALEQLMYIEDEIKKEGLLIREETLCVGVARIGSKDQKIVCGTIDELMTVDFGEPLHSLVICGKSDEIEKEMLEYFSFKNMDKIE